MTQSVTKAALSAVLSAAVAIPALAAEYQWTDNGSYSLGADDTLIISSTGLDSTLTMTGGSIDGTGTVQINNCTLELTYDCSATKPFSGFTGKIIVGENAKIYCNNARGGSWNESEPPWGKEPTIEFQGGTIRGFKQGNNVAAFNFINVPEGCSGLIDDREAASGNGCNLGLSRDFTGSGVLTVYADFRWVKLSGDNRNFAGTFCYTNFYNNSYSGFYFEALKTGSANADWVLNTARYIHLKHGASDTLQLGSLVAVNEANNSNTDNPLGFYVVNAGSTLEVGSKSDSLVNLPFTQNNITLKKVGAETKLTLGNKVAFVEGSAIAVNAGTLELDGCDISEVSTKFASDTTLKVTSNGGTAAPGAAFVNVDLTDGALSFPEASNWESGNTYTLFTYSGTMTGYGDGKVVVNVSGSSSVKVVDDGNGTVSAVVTLPSLAWANNSGAKWTEQNAWLNDEAPCSYAEGDKVSFKDGDVVLLDSEVSPKSFSVPAGATVTVIGSDAAKIAAESFSNNGILAISGDVVVDGQLAGNVNVAADSTLTFVDGQSLAGLKFTGTGKVKFNTSDTMDFTYQSLVDNGVFTGFSGTLELTGGVTLNNTSSFNNDSAVIFPSAMTILFNGGTITENVNSVNIRVHAKVVVESEANTFLSRQGNISFAGPIEGSGKIRLETYQRGVRFYGDNSNFEGEADLYAGDRYCSLGFDSKQTGSAKATWNLKNDKYSTSEEWGHFTLSFGYDYSDFTTEEKALHLGAFNVEKPNAILRTYSNPTWLVIGEKNEACAIEGRFTDGLETTRCKAVHIVKKGTDVLTLGTNTMVVDGSTVRVDEGTLEVKCENELDATITVKSGAVLRGTGSVASVTFEDGAKMDFAYPDSPERGSTVDGIVAASWSGKPTLANASAVNGGKWKLRTKTVEGGTQFYAEFMPSGLMVIFR